MIYVDATDVPVGRLASFVAKEALKGEEISVLNCNKAIITGNKLSIKKEFQEKRSRVGSGQRGPKHHATSEKIVKRTIRGMLPNHREGRGREAFKRVKCYVGVPKEFEGKTMINLKNQTKIKYSRVEEFTN